MRLRFSRHRLPVFEGRASRRHHDVLHWKLRLVARLGRSNGVRLDEARTFVQFVGFPRSGHSLIGALIDAHPDALISHELDAMGLLHAGFGYREIARLIARNSAEFAAHGKWWNGYSYDVPGLDERTPKVIGDKKGDWAARWTARAPELLDRLDASGAPRQKWLLVTRAPADNIATMTLRRNRLYDRIRIDAAREGRSSKEGITAAQEDGRLPTEASDAMIAEYRELCEAIAALQPRIAPEDWMEIDYDAFTATPEENLRRIAVFLDLTPEAEWLEACCSIVHSGRSRSRDRLTWREDQRAAVEELAQEFAFLGNRTSAP